MMEKEKKEEKKEEKRKEKLPLRRRIEITSRGFRLLGKYCPGLARDKAFHELVASLQPFVIVWFSARIIDEITGERRADLLALYVAATVFTGFLCAVAKGLINRVCSEKEAQMWACFGKIFSDKQMSLDFEDLENAGIQRQKKQVEENLYMFGNGMAQLVWGTATLVRCFVNLAASLSMSIGLFAARSRSERMNHPVWILILLLCIILGGRSYYAATVKQNGIFREWCKRTVWFDRMSTFFGNELFMESDRAKDVRIYEQNIMAERALDKMLEWNRRSGRSVFFMALYPALAGILVGLASAVCYLYVVLKAYFGAFGAGSIVQYVAVLSRLGDGWRELMYLLSDNATYCAYLQEMFGYLDLPNRKYQGTIPVEKRVLCQDGDNEYEIEFCNVSFRYPGSETWVLKDISVKLDVGKRLAIVGRNGSGKTTFIKLLCRLYDPTEGEIRLNGIDIRKYDYREYMSIFSVVFQDFRLFSFPLAQNVAAGREYDGDRVKKCLEDAGFGERLSRMPAGIETPLYKDFEQEGVEVSGGEAQKIALARGIYRNAPFLVLDEPTAALDPIAEAEVYARFQGIAGNRTAVYISHRLSSCKFCDTILVFHQGGIVQRGTHEELVSEEGGTYSRLWNAQARYYTQFR